MKQKKPVKYSELLNSMVSSKGNVLYFSPDIEELGDVVVSGNELAKDIMIPSLIEWFINDPYDRWEDAKRIFKLKPRHKPLFMSLKKEVEERLGGRDVDFEVHQSVDDVLGWGMSEAEQFVDQVLGGVSADELLEEFVYTDDEPGLDEETIPKITVAGAKIPPKFFQRAKKAGWNYWEAEDALRWIGSFLAMHYKKQPPNLRDLPGDAVQA